MPTSLEIRQSVLKHALTLDSNNLQVTIIARRAMTELELDERDNTQSRMVLTELGELIRTGHLAPGMNFSNNSYPWLHVTPKGQRTEEQFSRDPSNPAGYSAYVNSRVPQLDQIASSYLMEALDCYNDEHFKSSAVMLGGASERLCVLLAEDIKTGLLRTGNTSPSGLDDWRIARVIRSITSSLDSKKNQMSNDTRDAYEAHWTAFVSVIRASRNEAGHPASITPITESVAHRNLLIFGELAELVQDLRHFAQGHMT